jgi:Lon protease-like protein
MTERLPLFPLGTVLYPGLLLPLHIFEERYRLLMRELAALPQDQPRHFGVVAIRQGREAGEDGVQSLYEVGCTADVRQVEALPDGRFDIVTTGSRRFRLHDVDRSQPYLVGEVSYLDDPPGDQAGRLAGAVGQAYLRYRNLLLAARGDAPGDLLAESAQLPDDPVVLSYLIAAATVLDLADKQHLLEAADAAARLRAELRLLHREAEVLVRLPSMPAGELARQPVSLN